MPFVSGSTRFYKVLQGSARFCWVRSGFRQADQVQAPLSVGTKKKPADVLPETTAGHPRGSILFASDFRFAGRDRQHDPQSERNHEPNHDPDGPYVPERPAVPQGRERTQHEDEISNQVNVNKP